MDQMCVLAVVRGPLGVGLCGQECRMEDQWGGMQETQSDGDGLVVAGISLPLSVACHGLMVPGLVVWVGDGDTYSGRGCTREANLMSGTGDILELR